MNDQLRETEVECNDGTYVVNEGLVRRIIESYYRAAANNLFSEVVEMDTAWYEPGIWYVKTDWRKARVWAQERTRGKLYSTWMVSMPEMTPRIEELARMQRETVTMTAEYKRRVRDQQEKSRRSREKMISFWGGAATGAKFVRDASATTLMVGATVLSAGSAGALFAGGAGTALNFTGKLQDGKGRWQDNLGAASVQATGDLIFTIIPATRAGAAMRGAQGAQKAAIMFLEAKWDAMVSLLEGKEMSEALLDGSMSLLFKSAGELGAVSKVQDEIKSGLSDWMLPTMIRATGTKRAGTQGAKTLARSAVGIAQGRLKGGASAAANVARTSAISSSIAVKNNHRNGLDNAAVVDTGIVGRAVRRIH